MKWHAIGLGLGLSPQQLEEVWDNRLDDRDGCLKAPANGNYHDYVMLLKIIT